jgi:hypothetical protein
MMRRREDPTVVELSPEGIVVPQASINGGFVAVPYTDIWRISVRDVASQKMIVIDMRLGESRLMSSAFASFAEFSRFSALLTATWQANKAVRSTRETRAPDR